MVHIDKELINDFIVESQEGLALVETQMLAIEAMGAEINPDLVNEVFRTMHSIKGTAGFLGLGVIGALAHSLEEILDDLRNREMVPTSQIVSTVLKASDVMKELVDAVETSNEMDVQPLVEELQTLRQQHRGQSLSANAASADSTSPAASASTVVDAAPSAALPSAALPSAALPSAALPSAALPSAALPTAAAPTAAAPTAAAAVSVLPGLQAETLAEFLSQSRENLDQMEEDLLALEECPESRSLLRSVFRTLHGLAGGASLLGFRNLEALAATAEAAVLSIRDVSKRMTPEGVDVLCRCTERLRDALNSIESQQTDAYFQPGKVLELLQRLEAAQQPQTAAAPAPRERPAPVTLADRLGANASGSAAAGSGNVAQNASPEVARTGAVAASPPAAAASAATVLAAVPTSPQVGESEAVQAAQAWLAEDGREPLGAAAESATKGTSSGETIRVDVALLDKLMTRVGELVLARNQILQRAAGSEDANFTSTAQRLNLITTELQESVMKTRMQPIGNVWAKFPRVVRDLANQLSKQVRIEMEGKETELDKTIIEAIKDPLTHIVRNSIDHGLESPQARIAAGKNPEGLVLLRAYHEGGQVVIEIIDDGKGLDIDRIRRKAVERGLVTPDQSMRMSDREATQMILLPGFSTAEQVTSISGRGVGMDVVKTNIERIGGTLDIKTAVGKGTVVKIKIPLTLAIIPALIVTGEGDRFAIPQVSLLELVRLEGEQAEKNIEFLNGAPVYRLRGKLLPLVSLSERLGLPGRLRPGMKYGPDDVFNIVVLRANDTHFGLIVDKINDTEEIVVKPLSRQLKGITEYAGATIMGDGKVALILDVMGMAVAAGLVGNIQDATRGSMSRESSADERPTQTLLVVEGEGQRRFALPTCMVSRLETASVTSIEVADNQEVLQYRGAILPLIRLSGNRPMRGMNADDEADLKVIVYRDQDQSCGLIVDRIVDIVETQLELPRPSEGSSNLLGTTVLQDRVTDVLDLRKLARSRGRVTCLA
jgi:two-component system, chemotaxis family, sensor kinase CheA